MARTLPPEVKKAIGANIKEAREQAGFQTQKLAAPVVGVGRSLLNQWETGTYTPDADGLLRLAVAYKCPLDAFFYGAMEAYDTIIEQRIPIDVKQFYRAKIGRLKALTVQAIELTELAVGTHAPTREGPHGNAGGAREKSGSVHARRTRAKKTPPK